MDSEKNIRGISLLDLILLSLFCCQENMSLHFFLRITQYIGDIHNARTHPYEYTHTNSTLRSIFEDCAGKSSRLTKSPQAPRCRRERRLPLKAQTPLNPKKFALTGSRTQDLKCYWGMFNMGYVPFRENMTLHNKPMNLWCWIAGASIKKNWKKKRRRKRSEPLHCKYTRVWVVPVYTSSPLSLGD
jgi:hypothetical protein